MVLQKSWGQLGYDIQSSLHFININRIKMRIKAFRLIIFLNLILQISCSDLKSYKQQKVVDNNNSQIEENILVEDAFTHYPKLNEVEFINAEFTVPPRNRKYYNNSQRASSILTCGFNDSSSMVPASYLYKTNSLAKNNFIVSMIFKENVVFDNKFDKYYPDSYPIPNFEELDFNLGFEKVDTIINEQRYVYKLYQVPKDLEVYVQDAQCGSFWKEEAEVYRPKTMREWRNGYSKGVAISNERQIAIYWFFIW